MTLARVCVVRAGPDAGKQPYQSSQSKCTAGSLSTIIFYHTPSISFEQNGPCVSILSAQEWNFLTLHYRHVNFLGGSPLNRLSWLRSSQDFLNAIAALPQTRWALFNAGFPLVGQRDGVPYLAYLSTKEVKPILGSEPFFGQGKEIGTYLQADEVTTHTEAARHLNSPVVFLGLHEDHSRTGALPSSDFADAQAAVKNIEGTAYFSLDVASLDKTSEELEAFLQSTETASNGVKLSFSEPRSVMNKLDLFTSGVFAEARSMVDWNERNKVSEFDSSNQAILIGPL